MNKITIVLPECSQDNISNGLRQITKALQEQNKDYSFGFGLGGDHGYGYNYENSTFMMHVFCWCGNDDCDWCNGDAPNFWYKPLDLKIWWYKYIGRGMEVKIDKIDFGKTVEIPNWSDVLNDCINSIKGEK